MKREPTPLTGKAFLMWLLGSFAVVLGVNLFMVYEAISSFGGEIEEHSYLTGLHHNASLNAASAQKARGWHADTAFDKSTPGQLTVTSDYRDSEGRPIPDLTVVATFARPAQKALDREVTIPAVEAGVYRALVRLPEPGQWIVRVVAQRSGEAPYRLDYRVMVP